MKNTYFNERNFKGTNGSLNYVELNPNSTKAETIFLIHGISANWRDWSASILRDISSLGYRIDVYQESINKTFPEYLVNFDYLVQVIENYGFVLLERDEARSLGLPESMGNFDQLFYEMQSQIKHRRLRASDVQSAPEMTSDEKKISFLNKYHQ